MNNEELLDDLEREWTRAMEKVNEIENKIVQLKGIMARDAAEHRHAPVTGQATDKAIYPGYYVGAWVCEKCNFVNNKNSVSECLACNSPRQTVSD